MQCFVWFTWICKCQRKVTNVVFFSLACAASVSVGFGSKERSRNGIFGVLPARKIVGGGEVSFLPLRDICVKAIITCQNRAFMLTPALEAFESEDTTDLERNPGTCY